jgi:hypothetical protein
VLKNTSGFEAEQRASITFHRCGIPLLVSPKVLRERDMGQLDIVRITKRSEGWVIEVAEVKSSIIGTEMMMRGQRSRLISAMKFLSGIFSSTSKFILLSGKDSL